MSYRRNPRPPAKSPRHPGLFAYYGGKARLAPWIVEHMPSHLGYVEPFCGGARVLFSKPRARMEVINDLDGGVVAALRAARDYPDELTALLELTPHAREEFETAAHTAAEGWATPELLEAARLFLLLVKQGFAAQSRPSPSSWRIQRPGRNTGRAEHTWSRLPDVVWAAAERLQGVAIEHRNAFDVIDFNDHAEVLLYCDPPYHPRTCDVKGYAHSLSVDEHNQLAETLREFTGMVMLSGFRHPDYDVWYEGWHSIEHGHFSGAAAGAGSSAFRRTEILWFNPAAWDRLQSQGPHAEQATG